MPRLDRADWRDLASTQPQTRAWVRRSRHLPNRHTGRPVAHRHTSYASLMGLLALVGVGLGFATAGAGASGTESAPSVPTIVTPTLGAAQSNPFVTMSGNCAPGSFVLASRNDIFAGSAACADGGRYSLEVTLVPGSNNLTAQAMTQGGTRSDASPGVGATYQADVATATDSLLLRAAAAVHVARAGTPAQRTAVLSGGAAPYAVKWSFGDGTTRSEAVPTDGDVKADHTYARAGTYPVTIQIDDSLGRSARLSLVTVITNATGTAAGSGKTTIVGGLLSAWPFYLALLILIVAFALGELRETFKLRRLERAARTGIG